MGFLDASDSWGFGLGFGWFEGYAYNTASALRARLVSPTGVFAGGASSSKATDIVIVALSDQTFSLTNPSHLPGPPVPRNYQAQLIRFLSRSGAKIIAFDIIFDALRPEDKGFADAVRDAQRYGTQVVWGCVRDENNELILPNAQLRKASRELAHVLVERNPIRPLTERVIAFIDGNVSVGSSVEKIPALSLKVAMITKGIDHEQPQRITNGWQVGDFHVPIESNGTFAISYASTPGGAFPYVPFERLIKSNAESEFYRSLFKGKIVLVGDITKIGNDWKDTPLGIMPGVEVHAHAINTLLNGNFLRTAPVWLNLLIIALLPAVLGLFHDTRYVRTLTILIGFLFFGYLLLALWLFVMQSYSIHFIGPLLALSLFATLLLIERVAREERERQQMFDALVIAASSAIESRDPSTAGHSRRVTCLTIELAIMASCSRERRYKHIRFSKEQIKELCYSALLHDFGKIGVREAVLTKSHKLEPMHFQVVKDRLLLLRSQRLAEYWQGKALHLASEGSSESCSQQREADHQEEMRVFTDDLSQLEKANDPQVSFLPDAEYDALQKLLNRLAMQTYRDENGEENPLISASEKEALLIRKGSLTPTEYHQIQAHAQLSYDFLKQIKWTRDLKNLSHIAWGHHEKLNGSGYPRGIKGDEIPMATRMMTIADIYDALTAADRPYKRALPTEKALQILRSEAESGALDADLLELFIERRVYEATKDERHAWLFAGGHIA
jgi:HD-GYP domain-containing protein (c-di-GMP phosphodiesterase class II)/CHASE2 domain-containing sensor protein